MSALDKSELLSLIADLNMSEDKSRQAIACEIKRLVMPLFSRIAELENPWQPIETAPLKVRILTNWYGDIDVKRFEDNAEKELCEVATLWMPLPKPPEEK